MKQRERFVGFASLFLLLWFITQVFSQQVSTDFSNQSLPVGMQSLASFDLTINQVDASGFPAIKVYANVQDETGNSIPSLDKDNFLLTEDGSIELIEVGTLGSIGIGSHVALVLDRSSSLNAEELRDVQDAAIAFVNLMLPADSVALVTFAAGITINQPFTNNKTRLINAIENFYDNANAAGTLLNEAILVAADLTKQESAPRALVVMTDGQDNAHTHDNDDVIEILVDLNIPCYTVGLSDQIDDSFLIDVAEATHAAYYYAPTASDLTEIYQAISRTIQLQYQIGYTTHNPIPDGTWRNIHLSAIINAELDTDTGGYLAPYNADFILHVNPTVVDVYAGERGTFTVTIDSVNGFNETVSLTATHSMPAGVQVNFLPNPSVSVNSSVSLQITPDFDTPTGTYIIEVTGTYGEISHTREITLIVSAVEPVPVYPVIQSPQIAGDEFWVDINVGESDKVVNNLFGISMALHYTLPWVELVFPLNENIEPGPFIGSTDNTIFTYTPEVALTGDSLELAVTRTLPHGAVDGWGSVLRVKFKTLPETPDTTFCFRIENVFANDPHWNEIPLDADSLCIQITGQLDVWPGDTNNDGIVNQIDLLPIGLSWGQNGTGRSHVNPTEWISQLSRPWPFDNRYTYADANGDGVVDGADIPVLGLNWHLTHSNVMEKSNFPQYSISGHGGIIKPIIKKYAGENQIDIGLWVEGVENLLGLGLNFSYPPQDIKILSVTKGSLFETTPLFLSSDDSDRGILGIGLSHTHLQGSVTGAGVAVIIRVETKNIDILNRIGIENVRGLDASGQPLEFDLHQGIQNLPVIPCEFRLRPNFPNPFNPSTKLSYDIPEMDWVSLKVFDLTGAEVTTILEKQHAAGQFEVIWDGCDNKGNPVSTGIYYFVLQSGSVRRVQKGMLLK